LTENLKVERKLYKRAGKFKPPELGNSTPPLTPLLVARETNHSPEAVQRYCLGFNKVKWCVDNGMSKKEITIVTGMKSHLIDEYMVIIKEINA